MQKAHQRKYRWEFQVLSRSWNMNMNKQTFMDLTGENPEDMFGGDWQNEVNEIMERDCMYCENTFQTTIKENKEYCIDHA